MHASRREEEAAAALSLLSLVSPQASTNSAFLDHNFVEPTGWIIQPNPLDHPRPQRNGIREDEPEKFIAKSLSRKGKEREREHNRDGRQRQSLSPIVAKAHFRLPQSPALPPISISSHNDTAATHHTANGTPQSPVVSRKRKELHMNEPRSPIPSTSSVTPKKRDQDTHETRPNGQAVPGTIGYGHGKANSSQQGKRRSILNGHEKSKVRPLQPSDLSNLDAPKQTHSIDGAPKKRRRTSPLVEIPQLTQATASGINCICGFTHDDGSSVGCEECPKWAHAACFGIVLGTESEPPEWRCWECEGWLPLRIANARGKGKAIQQAKLQAFVDVDVEKFRDDPVDVVREDSEPDDDIPNAETLNKLKSVGAGWRGLSSLNRSQMNPFASAASAPIPVYLPRPPTQPPRTRRRQLPLQAYPPSDSLRGLGNSPEILPPSYALHAATPIAAKDLIAPFRSTITPSSLYLANAYNQYGTFGMPKPGVHLFGEPLGVALDARVPSPYVLRSGCAPNAVLRPVVREDREGVEFGVFALRDLTEGEEVVVGWEWDDTHIVHTISEEVKPELRALIHALSSVFATCACGEDDRCLIRCMEDYVEGRVCHKLPTVEKRGFSAVPTGFGVFRESIPTQEPEFRPPDPMLSPEPETLPSRIRRKPTVPVDHRQAMDVDVPIEKMAKQSPPTTGGRLEASPWSHDHSASPRPHSPPRTASTQSSPQSVHLPAEPITPPVQEHTSSVHLGIEDSSSHATFACGGIPSAESIAHEHAVLLTKSGNAEASPPRELEVEQAESPSSSSHALSPLHVPVTQLEDMPVSIPSAVQTVDLDLNSEDAQHGDVPLTQSEPVLTVEPDPEPAVSPEPEKPKVKMSLHAYLALKKQKMQEEPKPVATDVGENKADPIQAPSPTKVEESQDDQPEPGEIQEDDPEPMPAPSASSSQTEPQLLAALSDSRALGVSSRDPRLVSDPITGREQSGSSPVAGFSELPSSSVQVQTSRHTRSTSPPHVRRRSPSPSPVLAPSTPPRSAQIRYPPRKLSGLPPPTIAPAVPYPSSSTASTNINSMTTAPARARSFTAPVPASSATTSPAVPSAPSSSLRSSQVTSSTTVPAGPALGRQPPSAPRAIRERQQAQAQVHGHAPYPVHTAARPFNRGLTRGPYTRDLRDYEYEWDSRERERERERDRERDRDRDRDGRWR